MPRLGTYRIVGEPERQRTRLIAEVNRERPVVNAGFESAAQFRDHLTSNDVTPEQRRANAETLAVMCLHLEGLDP